MLPLKSKENNKKTIIYLPYDDFAYKVDQYMKLPTRWK